MCHVNADGELAGVRPGGVRRRYDTAPHGEKKYGEKYQGQLGEIHHSDRDGSTGLEPGAGKQTALAAWPEAPPPKRSRGDFDAGLEIV